jgi:RES domain-containing protein
MRLWRVSNHADLSGEGGRRVAGRWHERGRPVVYLSEHPALALLENLVHLEIDPEDLPSGYQILTVEVPDGRIESLAESELDRTAPGWRVDHAVTRGLTASWLVRRAANAAAARAVRAGSAQRELPVQYPALRRIEGENRGRGKGRL